MPRPMALSGTPGTGKTSVAQLLRPRWNAVEVAELAQQWGLARPALEGVLVDLPKLQARARGAQALEGIDVIVGHLAHLLPIRDVVLLRCNPIELEDRLCSGRKMSAHDRRENVESEATDLILWEAIERHRRIWEIDTTGRMVTEVARDVERRLRLRGPARYGAIDWLADPKVTEHLIPRSP